MAEKRLLIILVLSGKRKKALDTLVGTLSGCFDNTVLVSDSGLENSISSELFCRNLPMITDGFKKIYFVSDKIMTCTDSLDEVLVFFENGVETRSLWSGTEIYGEYDHKSTREKFPLFLCVDCASENFKTIADVFPKADSIEEMVSFLSVFSVRESYFSYWVSNVFPSKDNIIPFCFNAYEYLRAGFPLFPCVFFELDRMEFIKYGTDNMPSMVFKRLSTNRARAECLLEYFAEECDASQLKSLLQLNFIVSPKGEYKPPENEKCAVFAHLYYERYFDRYLKYLAAAAIYCDIYVSVNTEEKKALLLSMAGSIPKSRLTVVIAENRGRDLSALLVAFKPYITLYEYFCFLHDKSAHKYEAETVGRAFSDCMWDNLLGNGTVIPEVIAYFEENPFVGLLVPPTPYWGVYMDLKSNFWTVCYGKTLELSERLGLSVKISNEINPAALGTAFWCRRDALAPLSEYPWSYEDFDEEPLEIDGTLGHALERIFPYVALHRRFLTAWIISKDFLPRILESHLLLTEQQMRRLKECPVPYAAGKTANRIGLKGALVIFKEASALLFKSFVKFFIKHFHKSNKGKERKI